MKSCYEATKPRVRSVYGAYIAEMPDPSEYLGLVSAPPYETLNTLLNILYLSLFSDQIIQDLDVFCSL